MKMKFTSRICPLLIILVLNWSPLQSQGWNWAGQTGSELADRAYGTTGQADKVYQQWLIVMKQFSCFITRPGRGEG
jgi:hypothetical protein